MSKVIWSFADKPAKAITLYIGKDQKVISEDNPNFEQILQCLRDKEGADVIMPLVDKALAVKNHCRGLFDVRDGLVYINDEVLPPALSNKIVAFQEQDFDVLPLVHFWNNLSKNPSFHSVQQLFGFLDANSVPIVDEGVMTFEKSDGSLVQVDCAGFFVSWKAVRDDFKDGRTGKFDNSPGKVVEMERRMVDDNPDVTCSSGLHVAAWDYAKNFMSGRYVKVYVDPADVVSVPTDYNNQKMRTCRYYVVEEIQGNELESVYDKEKELVHKTQTFVDEYMDEEDEDDYDDEYDDYDDDFLY